MWKNWKGSIDYILIILFALIPLFMSFPYRVNIFLSWEGAFRISEGHLPFRDFGTPLGGMYWVIPALFFKIFGAHLISLVKAQVFINIISGISFSIILRRLGVDWKPRFLSVFIYCISFSFFNFWPWYNHTVIVYEFVGLAFLLTYIFKTNSSRKLLYVLAGGVFMVFSFLTKQDGGAMAFLIGVVLLGYHAILEKQWKGLALYIGSFIGLLITVILALGSESFGYWFNHGQAPHSSRVSVYDLIAEFLGASQWIKFYLFLIVLLVLPRFNNLKEWWQDKTEMIFLILVICILGEAAVFQITSYTPPDNNIFFHSFMAAFLLFRLGKMEVISFRKPALFAIMFCGVLVWWSGIYWKYISRIAAKTMQTEQADNSETGENIVNRHNYMNLPELHSGEPEHQWKFCDLKSFERIYMPSSTVEGIHRLMQMELVQQKKPLKVLNMTELTPLANEIPYELEKSKEYPLWYHLGVSMFNKEAKMFEDRIAANHYDLILFENIPYLNNFYPFRTRESLQQHYQLVDSFAAPRRGDTQGVIEVYVRK